MVILLAYDGIFNTLPRLIIRFNPSRSTPYFDGFPDPAAAVPNLHWLGHPAAVLDFYVSEMQVEDKAFNFAPIVRQVERAPQAQ